MIDAYLQDPEITEVLINNFSKVYLEKKGSLFLADFHFSSENEYHQYIYRLLKISGENIDNEKPIICFQLGQARFQIVSPVITKKDYLVSIRKHHFGNLNLSTFCDSNETFKLVQKILKSQSNFIVIGKIGSGKTSLINACMESLSPNERLIVLEDTPELSSQNSIGMYTRTNPLQPQNDITLSHLIKETLRLRPDRIVVGEVRGPEAKDLLMALSTGHKGSFGTLHAGTPQESLLRLEMLVQLGAPQWSLETVRRIIYFGIEYIILVEKKSDGKRKIQQISKIAGLESSGLLLENLL